MKRKHHVLENIFSSLLKDNPNPKTELNYTNDFTLLVAIILSAQSTDLGVNKATAELFKIVKNPQDLLSLGEEKLKSYIKSLGLFNSKAKNLMALSQILVNKEIPSTIEELEKLPGVGSKTAKVYLNCAKNAPVIAVDTHVFRVSKRLGIASGSNVKVVEKILNETIPNKWKILAHHLLILHGRYVCKARSPLCKDCSVQEYCKFFRDSY